ASLLKKSILTVGWVEPKAKPIRIWQSMAILRLFLTPMMGFAALYTILRRLNQQPRAP
ncbi:MAG: hypothetical protein ACI8WB_004052, partial [Phenylobacterium sp.]